MCLVACLAHFLAPHAHRYRGNFTEALQQEAAAIKACRSQGGPKLYIWDPNCADAAVIRANLQDGTSMMGDVKGWLRLVESVQRARTLDFLICTCALRAASACSECRALRSSRACAHRGMQRPPTLLRAWCGAWPLRSLPTPKDAR